MRINASINCTQNSAHRKIHTKNKADKMSSLHMLLSYLFFIVRHEEEIANVVFYFSFALLHDVRLFSNTVIWLDILFERNRSARFFFFLIRIHLRLFFLLRSSVQ